MVHLYFNIYKSYLLSEKLNFKPINLFFNKFLNIELTIYNIKIILIDSLKIIYAIIKNKNNFKDI